LVAGGGALLPCYKGDKKEAPKLGDLVVENANKAIENEEVGKIRVG
jgi:hypothetical protein